MQQMNTMGTNRERWTERIGIWTWAHRLTAIVFIGLLVASWQSDSRWLHGSPTATRFLNVVPFVDPLAAVEATLAARHATWTIVLGSAITVCLALLLGRVFCGWLCPVGLLLELNWSLRRRALRWLQSRQISVPSWDIGTGWKYGLLLAALTLSLIYAMPVFTAISPVNWCVLAVYGVGRAAWYGFAALLVLEWFAPRIFCRSLCPLGALYALLGRWAPWRVRVRGAGAQLACRKCSQHCPMGIPVMQDHVLQSCGSVGDPECVRCGACVDVCRGRVLTLAFRSDHAAARVAPDLTDIQPPPSGPA